MSAKMRRTAKRLPIACELSEGGQRSRREEISRELFSGCKDMRELEDGYEFVFPGGEEWIERLARFVAEERECCRFFAFEFLLRAGTGTGFTEDAWTGWYQRIPRGAVHGGLRQGTFPKARLRRCPVLDCVPFSVPEQLADLP